MDYVFHFSEVLRYWPWLVQGTATTLLISVAAMILSVFFGTLFAVARRSRHAPLRWAAVGYVDVIRNTPLLVQLYILYFGLPNLGLRLDALVAGFIGVVIYNTAFTTEAIRAGLQAIHKGQIESGLSIGMSRFQVFIHVVILPALEKVYPTLCSQFVLLMLGTSIVSAIGVDELTSMANRIQAINFRSIEVYLLVIVLYFALTLLIRSAAHALQPLLFRHRRRRRHAVAMG